jgi:hypothetical protein
MERIITDGFADGKPRIFLPENIDELRKSVESEGTALPDSNTVSNASASLRRFGGVFISGGAS